MNTKKIEVCSILELYKHLNYKNTAVSEHLDIGRATSREMINSAKHGNEVLVQVQRKPNGTFAFCETFNGVRTPRHSGEPEDVDTPIEIIQTMLSSGFSIDSVAEFMADGRHIGRTYERWQTHIVNYINRGIYTA